MLEVFLEDIPVYSQPQVAEADECSGPILLTWHN